MHHKESGSAAVAPTGASDLNEETSTKVNSEELPTDGAPKVKNPLDTSKYQQDPCLSLTSAQVQGLNLPAGGDPVSMPLGKACEWRNPETQGRVQIGFLDKDPHGLSSEYRAEVGAMIADLALQTIKKG